MSSPPFLLTLISSQTIAPNTKHFTFLAQQPLTYKAGQFITLHFPTSDGILLKRSYSIANHGGIQTSQIELAASYIPNGVASERLFTMKPGDTLQTTGPFGRFTLREEKIVVTHYLLVATGTGITPYRTMLPELAVLMQKDSKLKVSLLFGIRHLSDVLYRDEFIAFAKTYPQFELRIHYSRYTDIKMPYEYQGYVLRSLETMSVQANQSIAYLCGNPNMVDQALSILHEKKGLSSIQIRREKYFSPK